MVIKAKTKILKNPQAKTQYITIPSDMTQDSQYPFKPGDEIELEVDGKKGTLIVKRST